MQPQPLPSRTTLAAAPAPEQTLQLRQSTVTLETTCSLQFIDITALVAERVRDAAVTHGLVNVQSLHTTAAIMVNENEPLLLQDLRDFLQRLAPADGRYRHDRLDLRITPVPPGERANGHAHTQAMALSASATLAVSAGRLIVGRWQSLFLVELDGGRARDLSITVMGAAALRQFPG